MYAGELIFQSVRLEYLEGGIKKYSDCENCKWRVDQKGKLLPTLKGIGPLKRSTTYTPIISVHSQFRLNNFSTFEDTGHVTLSCKGKPFVTDFWICKDGHQKIPATSVCDNPTTPDCLDGSDENDLTCMGGLNIHVIMAIGLYFFLGFIFVVPGDR